MYCVLFAPFQLNCWCEARLLLWEGHGSGTAKIFQPQTCERAATEAWSIWSLRPTPLLCLDCPACSYAPTRRNFDISASQVMALQTSLPGWGNGELKFNSGLGMADEVDDGRDGTHAQLASLVSKAGEEEVPGSTFGADEMGWVAMCCHEASNLWPKREVLCLARPRTNHYSVVAGPNRARGPNLCPNLFPSKAHDTISCTFNWKTRIKENNAEPVHHVARLWPPPLPCGEIK